MKLLYKPSFSPMKMLPIFQKYKTLSEKTLKPLSTYHKICLSVIVPHASTDVLVNSNHIPYVNYLFSSLFFTSYGIRLKYFLFFMYSVYHIRNDIQGKFITKIMYSLLVHSSWVYFPEFSLSYLAWIHVFIHYNKIFPMISITSKISMLCLTFFVYLIIHKIDINEVSQKGYWIPFVIGHILTVN